MRIHKTGIIVENIWDIWTEYDMGVRQVSNVKSKINKIIWNYVVKEFEFSDGNMDIFLGFESKD